MQQIYPLMVKDSLYPDQAVIEFNGPVFSRDPNSNFQSLAILTSRIAFTSSILLCEDKFGGSKLNVHWQDYST
ncbi:predicted protein [Methanosarcina acetivorans C2A]|uniref:Uncharacterized protein n=1 Tax=Methanosarcina acetivorans (strain ATCC 35395 / DSM 2834 / JCM 12185 / C2A) TaxID=188937 RepID=Q8TJS6_METAC|nr:predicted protein [Methanosarcina acetivorans C2A]